SMKGITALRSSRFLGAASSGGRGAGVVSAVLVNPHADEQDKNERYEQNSGSAHLVLPVGRDVELGELVESVTGLAHSFGVGKSQAGVVSDSGFAGGIQ